MAFRDRTRGSTQTPPGTKPCAQLLPSPQHSQNMSPSGLLCSACILSLIPPVCQTKQTCAKSSTCGLTQRYRDAHLTFLPEHPCSIHPEGYSPCWGHLLATDRGGYFPGRYLASFQGRRTNSRSWILSAKPKDNRPLRAHSSGPVRAGSCFLLQQGRTARGQQQ